MKFIVYLMVIIGMLAWSILEDIINKSDRHSKSFSKHMELMRNEEALMFEGIIGEILSNLKKGKFLKTALMIVIIYLVAKMLFKVTILSIILSLFGLLYPKILLKKEKERKKEIIESQFRDVMSSIMSSLKSGLSLRSALIKCHEDLQRLHVYEKEKVMLLEFEQISLDLGMGSSVDEVLRKFGKRINVNDVDDFVNSVIIVREKGGNLVEVMENVTQIIADKISVKLEIKKLTTEKKQEAKILSFLPFIVISLLSVLSPSYMTTLYTTPIGRILIVVGVGLLVINYFVTGKITDIEI